MGSCFVENIGEKLDYFKFNQLQNPFGILFNPASLERLIKRAANKKFFSGDELFFLNGQWHCFDTHSRTSDANKEVALEKHNLAITLTHRQIKDATHVLITLGTAWVYRHKKSGRIVTNCHKIPGAEFEKVLMSVAEIREVLENIVTILKSENANLRCIFTVSPVRHLKDGFMENTRSKAHLITALHKLIEKEAATYYFPAYEIVLDELRDYRFYAEDMVHPNALGVNYIWEKFKKVWIDENVFQIMAEVDTVQKGLAHRPVNPKSEEHLTFKNKLAKKIERLNSAIPGITWQSNT